MIEYLTGALHREQDSGRVPSHVDPALEAETLVALAIEVGTDMLMTLRTADAARALLDYHLRRLFPDEPTDEQRTPPTDVRLG